MDPVVIRRAQGGDVDAFTMLATERTPAMTRTAMAILGHEADARDAVQETLTSVWRELPALRDPASFDAWSTRILVNACRRTLRARGRARVRELPIVTMTEDSNEATASGSMDDGVVRRRALERAFERLDPDARTLLVLHHLDERPLAEIAAVLAVPVGTVKSRLHSARQALQRALEREDR